MKLPRPGRGLLRCPNAYFAWSTSSVSHTCARSSPCYPVVLATQPAGGQHGDGKAPKSRARGWKPAPDNIHGFDLPASTSQAMDEAVDEIVIKPMGRAINKTVTIVELLKRRIAGLHQNNSIESIDITDTWEPLEEGLNILETTRHVSLITVTLSKKELDTSSPGYQPLIHADQVRAPTEFDQDAEDLPSGRGKGRGRRGRGRGRGFSNEGADYDNENGDFEGPRGYRGRGRGRGRRGSFGPGRGYGGDGYVNEEAGGYHGGEYNAPPAQVYG